MGEVVSFTGVFRSKVSITLASVEDYFARVFMREDFQVSRVRGGVIGTKVREVRTALVVCGGTVKRFVVTRKTSLWGVTDKNRDIGDSGKIAVRTLTS